MFTGLGTFGNAIVLSAQQNLTPLIVAAALLAGGATWALGKHDDGKRAVLAALCGGAVMLLAITMSTALVAIPH